ncbi:hypothetical protein C2845_PM02G10720 [Panicum miliaceum]|uniref:At1g61320/AtMIF1 LRR domain-containing protein n=1 Tax=Panicum miliaceum TaxID=4540 RepID=A0A3L6S9V1_PANMI|nr:hypothetical protein C2845_PM02G10720 [Panicum miliaceum]
MLVQDILGHIHSLMPLRDSARSACVSCTFLRSWRCYPKLTLTEKALGLTQKKGQKSDIAMDFTSRVDHILENHSGSGVKILELVIPGYCNVNTCRLNNWLQNAITPGIEEVALLLRGEDYNFPCSILHNGCGNSIRNLHLTYCAFLPMVGFDCLRSLTKLDLNKVRITGDELGYLISNSFALEQLILGICNGVICLKIPFWLERLSYLRVFTCHLGKSSQLKNLNVGFSHEPDIVSYATTKLPSIVQLLETLTISSINEIKHTGDMKHDSISGDAHMRQIPEHKHDRLKKVQINGFFCAKSMAELTCYVLENATSLESLTVDTIYNPKEDGNTGSRCCVERTGECRSIRRDFILEGHKALGVIKRYIVGRVPSSVKLNVGEPCTRCHAIGVKKPKLSNN